MPFFSQPVRKTEVDRMMRGMTPEVVSPLFADSPVTPQHMRQKMAGRIQEFREQREPPLPAQQLQSAVPVSPGLGQGYGEPAPAGPPPAMQEAAGAQSVGPVLQELARKKGAALEPSDLPPRSFAAIGMDPQLPSYLTQNLITERTYNAAVSAAQAPSEGQVQFSGPPPLMQA